MSNEKNWDDFLRQTAQKDQAITAHKDLGRMAASMHAGMVEAGMREREASHAVGVYMAHWIFSIMGDQGKGQR